MNSEVGRDEDRGGNVFHPTTQVISVRSEECRVKIEKPRERKRDPNWWLPPLRPMNCAPEVAENYQFPPSGGEGVWRRPSKRARRLGREPDRELRPYGTL